MIRPATAEDRATVEGLLAAAALPLDGFADHLHDALVAEAAGKVVGAVAVEVYGKHGLLRSLVVAPPAGGGGIGGRLVKAAVALAQRRGVSQLWLLTTTAERFFPRFGFSVIPRRDLPDALAASAALRGACPASAVAMRLEVPC